MHVPGDESTGKEWSKRLGRVRDFLKEDLWQVQYEPRSWPARGLGALQFVMMIGEGFVRDHLMLRASALTYFTVLSLVPMVAIVIAIASAMGVTANVAEVVVEQVAAGSPESQQRILDLIAGANIAGLGGLGAAVLFFTTVMGISNIERTFNHIWGVQKQRTVGRRFTDYLAVLVVAPLLMGSSLSLATTLKSQWLVQRLIEIPTFALLYDVGLQQMPAVVLTLAFAFLYWFLPNTSVRPLAALLGGATAAVLVNLAQGAYLGFSIGAARAHALYGGFAQIPLLFVWIYVFWAIVLFGGEVAFAYQSLKMYRKEVRGRVPNPAEREAIGLRIALEVARVFRDRDAPWTAEQLSDVLGIPVRAVREVLEALREAGIVASTVADGDEEAVQLGRPAEAVHVMGVLAALRGARDRLGGDPEATQIVEQLLDEIAEAESKGSGGQTLADLLVGIPARQLVP